MEVIIIAAIAKNNVIGANNDLIWDLPDDLKRFVSLTKGHTVLMGRKTFDSLYIKPLPKRDNIVLTKDVDLFDFEHPSVYVFNDIEKAIAEAKNFKQKLYIIGGGQIYNYTLPFATKLEITHIHSDYKGDTFFPEIDLNEWKIIGEEYHERDEKHLVDFTFTTYTRKK